MLSTCPYNSKPENKKKKEVFCVSTQPLESRFSPQTLIPTNYLHH
jgi:hypothetical protein